MLFRSPTSFNDRDNVERENAFGILSGRRAGVDGLTTQPLPDAKPAGTPSENAKNKVGEEKKLKKSDGSAEKGEKEGGREGISKARAADVAFANINLGSIIEIGGVLVDKNFKEKDRFNFRCRLPEGEIPQAMALIVNKTSVKQLTQGNLSHYQMLGEVEKIFKKWSPAIFLG